LEKGYLLSKKFHDGIPLTPYIAIVLAEGTPFLKNFKPNPGVKLSKASLADFLDWSASLAQDNLIKPCLAPLKTPVYFDSLATNSTYPTTPTEWIYFTLPLRN